MGCCICAEKNSDTDKNFIKFIVATGIFIMTEKIALLCINIVIYVLLISSKVSLINNMKSFVCIIIIIKKNIRILTNVNFGNCISLRKFYTKLW